MYLLNLGRVAYDEALALQRWIAAARKAGQLDDVLLLLEHPPVVTLGRQADEGNIIATPEVLDDLGIQVHRVERGGDVTYHGPGQLVGYPILDLRNHRKDIRWYVSSLAQVLVDTLAEYGIDADGRTGRETGIWVGNDKLAAIGVRIERWVTYHGFALNIDPIMSHFDLIVPCGLHGIGVTSMRRILGKSIDMGVVRLAVVGHFDTVFNANLKEVTLAELGLVDLESPLPAITL